MSAETLSIVPELYDKLLNKSPPKYFSFQDVALDLTGLASDPSELEFDVVSDEIKAQSKLALKKKSEFNRSMTLLTMDSEDVLSKFTFAKCRYEDLKACDVEELLRQYKELYNIVERNARHKRIFDSSDGDADPVNKTTIDTHFIPTTSPI